MVASLDFIVDTGEIVSPTTGVLPVSSDTSVPSVSLRTTACSGIERRRHARQLSRTAVSFPLQPAGNSTLGYRLAKRVIDIIGSATLLVIASPILLVTYLALFIATRGKPIFTQERVGYCGHRFRMYKFRTMYANAEERQHEVINEQSGPVFKNRRDPRVTRLGWFLRTTSIDELPQLVNVLRGEMSLVGPRPPVMKEVAKYEPWQLRRLQVKPGLTCLWQVSGRCEIGFHDWVRMDIWYVEHQNLWTDLMLIMKTPASVLSRRGAY